MLSGFKSGFPPYLTGHGQVYTRCVFVYTLCAQCAPAYEVTAMTAAIRQTTINLRAQAPQRSLIDQAARVAGKTRTDFMLEAACEKAQQVLLDQTLFSLDVDRFERFQALLDAPVEQGAALRKLMDRQAPWEA